MKRMNDEDKRRKQVVAYMTEGEDTALNLLGTDYGYDGKSDVLRRGLAALILAKHPELSKHLRKDLIPPLTTLPLAPNF